MSHYRTVLWKTLAIAAAMLAFSYLARNFVLSDAADGDATPHPLSLLLPLVLATIALVAVMVFPASRSALRGRSLFLAAFSVVVGLNVLLTHVEAAVFLDMEGTTLLAGVGVGTARAAVLALLVVLAFGRSAPSSRPVPREPSPQGALGWIARIGVSSFSYLVLYFVAGMLIFPYVADFYETQDLSIGLELIPLQLLRGALYVAFALPLLRSMVAPRWQVALATALLFPVLAGALDVLVPNPFMPASVRPFHAVEIGWSNFVFGLLVGYLFWNPRAGVAVETEASVQASAANLAADRA